MNLPFEAHRRQGGYSVIELMIVILIIAVIAAFVLPRFLESRQSANETSAIGSLRIIKGAEEMYRTRNGRYATMAELLGANLIDESFSGADRSGYTFTDVSAPTASTYEVTAEPASASEGGRFFFMDHSGVIRFSTAGSADDSSPPVQ